MQEWLTKSAADLGRDIAKGAIDPVDLTEAYLTAIKTHEFSPRIYARLTESRARSEAKAASIRAGSGQRLSLLDGVPISWKDLYDTAGTATEAGSALLSGRIPMRDAQVLKNASAAGLVCLGKTHMTELAFSGLGLNPVTQSPPCINDFAAVSGGSSSGAATSVAFGLAACGIGSDTGGSVRVPAGWNDLVGLKTTSGRVSLTGVVPLCAKFDTVGPLARTVEDAALMLAALEGGRAVDLRSASLVGRRLAVLSDVVMDGLESRVQAGFQQALDAFKNAGAVIETITAPEVTEAIEISGILYTSEAYGTWAKLIEANPTAMYPEVLARFRAGASHSAPDYVAAWLRLDAMRQEWNKRIAAFDAVLCPTAPIMPPNKQRLEDDGSYFTDRNLLTLRNTRVGNLMGGCAVTLPTGQPSVGVSLMGLPMQEERLLRLAQGAEQALQCGAEQALQS
ncbi:MAG: amidase [Paracoccaceae bacterium]